MTWSKMSVNRQWSIVHRFAKTPIVIHQSSKETQHETRVTEIHQWRMTVEE
jgi:hypothetical protein